MSLFDPKVPSELLSIQQWFASIITQPIDRESHTPPISPSGRPLAEEAMEIISPGPVLTSDQRIQIYNQQYWWRLLSILHQNFPLLTRLFGYMDFNISIGMPFLIKHPPHHWALARLGAQLPSWIEEHYTAQDKSLILSSAEVDWAYQELFLAPSPLCEEPSPKLLSKKMRLQKHLKLLTLPFDLFSFRQELLKEKVEFWMESDFPPLSKGKTYYFLVYRDQQNRISYKEIPKGHWTLLHMIEGGATIEEACEHLEKKGGSLYEEACTSLSEWIHEWIQLKCLMVTQ